MEYKNRISDKKLKDKLGIIGAVLIEGAKLTGKTTSASHFAASSVLLNDPDSDCLNLAKIKPGAILKGDTPLLIDEWQLEPKIWDAVRFEVDRRSKVGQFILTGSATPIDQNKIFHSGIGRISRMVMRPMSLYESGDSSGEISLSSLFNSIEDIYSSRGADIEELTYLICRGGWPSSLALKRDNALNIANEYVAALIETDLKKSIGHKFNKDKMSRLLKSYSRNIGTQIKMEEINKDILASDEISTFGITTLYTYIDALKDSYIIEDAEAWNANLRSKTIIRSTPTRYFVDPSIAVASLAIGPKDLENDIKTLGFFFENMVIRDLRVYADSIDGNVYHYLDNTNLECDAIIHLRNGKYGLVEIKLGGSENIEKGASTLNKLEKKLDTDKMNKPSFKMVIIGVGNFAYQRDDGVLVVPITSLKN